MKQEVIKLESRYKNVDSKLIQVEDNSDRLSSTPITL